VCREKLLAKENEPAGNQAISKLGLRKIYSERGGEREIHEGSEAALEFRAGVEGRGRCHMKGEL